RTCVTRTHAMNVYPSLTYRDPAAALEFLQKAFGFEPQVLGTAEDGTIRYAALKHGAGAILVQPDLPDDLHGSHLRHGWLYCDVFEVAAHFERAKAAGAAVLSEPHDAIGGRMRGYSARDPEGNLWSFGVDRPDASKP